MSDLDFESTLKNMYSTTLPLAVAQKDGYFIQSNGAFDDLVGRPASIWDLIPRREDVQLQYKNVTKHWGNGEGMEISLAIAQQNNGQGDVWWCITARAPDMLGYVPYEPSYMLKQIFDRVMKNGTTTGSTGFPLFEDWETYVGHLPFRQSANGTWQKIVDYPYYARKEDLQVLASQLERKGKGNSRPTIKYITAPTGSGKTASVAAAFTTSVTEGHNYFSHYVHIAFENNKSNNFRANGIVSEDNEVAQKQGAYFALQCLQKVLNAQYSGIQVVQSPQSLEDTAAEIAGLLEQFPGTKNVLIHLDEHRKMHDNPSFRRGAMESLASFPKRATVVTTYIDRPVELPESSSSGVCRDAIALPPLDIRAVMKNVKELCLPVAPGCFEGPLQRQWASFLFRLAEYVKENLSKLHCRDDQFFNQFLADFDNVRRSFFDDKICLEEALRELFPMFHCVEAESIPSQCEAYELLLGMKDKELNRERIGHGLVAYSVTESADAKKADHVLFSATVRALANHQSDAVEGTPLVCDRGALLFKTYLDSRDLLAATPLEQAYLWTLATLSAAKKKLTIGDQIFVIECKNIKPGRIFAGTQKDSFSLEEVCKLQTSIIYYADEKHDDVKTHPFGDIFFLTPDKELVLLDVTGATRKKTVNKKARRLGEWVTHARGLGNSEFTFHGAVLAPFVDHVANTPGGVSVVAGVRARTFLGGLTQMLAWFAQDI